MVSPDLTLWILSAKYRPISALGTGNLRLSLSHEHEIAIMSLLCHADGLAMSASPTWLSLDPKHVMLDPAVFDSLDPRALTLVVEEAVVGEILKNM